MKKEMYFAENIESWNTPKIKEMKILIYVRKLEKYTHLHLNNYIYKALLHKRFLKRFSKIFLRLNDVKE